MQRAAVWLAALGLLFGGHAASSVVAQDLVNPVPATETSLARGQEIYGQQ